MRFAGLMRFKNSKLTKLHIRFNGQEINHRARAEETEV